MFTLLLIIIYIAFVSLGLPDSLLGSAWPTINEELNVPLSYAGIITILISGGTIISSLLSNKIIHRFGTGLVVALSVLLTAIALFGFSISHEFYLLLLFAVPYGLGAGAIDSALNNYVAIHYSGRAMSFLHCFWGIGTIISPTIMSICLTNNYGWNSGYRFVSFIQLAITILLFLALPLWRKCLKANQETKTSEKDNGAIVPIKEALKINGVKNVLIGFFAYCSLEATLFLWSSSYLVKARGFSLEKAALFGSLFFVGMTVGRFISGLITDKIGDKKSIRLGTMLLLLGVVFITINFKSEFFNLAGFVIMGLGAGPIFPSIIHDTPNSFGEKNSQALIGLQMACAYLGSTLMPPLFGIIANNISIKLLPAFVFFFLIILIVMMETMNKKLAKKNKK